MDLQFVGGVGHTYQFITTARFHAGSYANSLNNNGMICSVLSGPMTVDTTTPKFPNQAFSAGGSATLTATATFTFTGTSDAVCVVSLVGDVGWLAIPASSLTIDWFYVDFVRVT